MAWTEIMISSHAALARAEWAPEKGNGDKVAQEVQVATAQAMLAWLRAHDPSAPVWYGYASVLQDFDAVAKSGPAKGVLSLHFRVANLDPAFQGMETWNQAAPGLPARASPPSTDLPALLEAAHGAIRGLEGELKGEGQCGD